MSVLSLVVKSTIVIGVFYYFRKLYKEEKRKTNEILSKEQNILVTDLAKKRKELSDIEDKILKSEDIQKTLSKEIKELKQIHDEEKKEVEKIKGYLQADVEAKVRKEVMENDNSFYKLEILNEHDFNLLLELRNVYHNPQVINKLIWSEFFQKQTNELCNRVIGKDKKCGIYKITNLITNECYIGQSVDISSRWKTHIKNGLGIETAFTTNKLYRSMQKYGIQNFTFELIEECNKEQLNEKEKFYIEANKSDVLGLNSTKGNKTNE